MNFRRIWVGILIITGICLLTAGCAAFLEDYQYNPAGPLYTQ